MIKIYPNINNSRINFGNGTISPSSAQELINELGDINQAVDTVGNDPYYKSLAKKLSKIDRKGNPKIKGTEEQLSALQDKVDKLNHLKDRAANASSKFKKEGNVPVDNVPKWVQTMFKKASNTRTIQYLMRKGPKGIALALAAGNVGKELVGTTVYTIQALTNEDLPADKRRFIGMYDLIVGLISTTFSAIFGFGAIAVQDKIISRALEKNKGKGFPKYAAAFAGLVWLIPQVLQTIIGKRIVAPAIATPVAGKIKNKMIAKAEAKKAQANQAEVSTPVVAKKAQAVMKPAETIQDTKAEEPQQAVTVKFISLSSYVSDAQEAKNAA